MAPIPERTLQGCPSVLVGHIPPIRANRLMVLVADSCTVQCFTTSVSVSTVSSFTELPLYDDDVQVRCAMCTFFLRQVSESESVRPGKNLHFFLSSGECEIRATKPIGKVEIFATISVATGSKK